MVLLFMLALVTKRKSRSIQFLQEELLKNFDATCVFAILAILPRGRQTLSATVMVQIISSAKKALENTRSLSSFSLLK